MQENNLKSVQIIYPKKNMYSERLKRVAAYCRVSTDSDDQCNSFMAQVSYYNNFIKRNKDMILVDIYADEGITGTCTDKREEFIRMMKDSKAGKIDRIYVKSVSRFSRNSLECLENVRLLKSYGTSVFFENDKIDTEKMNSEMILYIKSAFAQSEALAGSKRVSTAVKMKMREGESPIFRVPYGFCVKNNTLIPVEECKPVIEYIYREYLSGTGMGRIAEKLNKSKSTDRKWNISAVRYILENEKYAGDSMYQKTYTPQIFPLRNRPNYGEADKYYISNSHEAIIPRDLYNLVHIKLEQNKNNKHSCKNRDKNIFDNMIKCGSCGWNYKMKIQNNANYWVCSQNGLAGKKCTAPNISEASLKDLYVKMYNKLKEYEAEILDKTLSYLTSAKVKIYTMNDSVAEIDKELAKLAEQNSLYNRLKLRNIIDDVSYHEKAEMLYKKISDLRKQRAKMINSDDDEKYIEKLKELKNFIDSGPAALLEFNAEIFEKTVDKIYVYSDRIIQFELLSGLRLEVEIK